jgi:hypothetical protein
MDGQLIQKKDCTAAVQAAMPEAKSLAQVSHCRVPSERRELMGWRGDGQA